MFVVSLSGVWVCYEETQLGRSTIHLVGRCAVMQRTHTSQVEGELVEVHIAGDRANLRTEASNLVCKHAGRWNLYSVVPVVVVVAQGIREVQDGHLADLRGVLRDVEMRRFDRTLRDGVWHEEEVKFAIDNLRLLDKASINVSSLRRVVNVGIFGVRVRGLLEESLANTLVHDDKRDVRWILSLSARLRVAAVLHLHNPVKLFEFLVNDLLSH